MMMVVVIISIIIIIIISSVYLLKTGVVLGVSLIFVSQGGN